MIFNYRKTTKAEDETWGIQCIVLKPNSMRCDRRVTRVVDNTEFMCESHFQIKMQLLRSQDSEENHIQFIDQDAGGEMLTGKSEPLEK